MRRERRKYLRVLQVERGLHVPVHRLRIARHGAGEIEIGGAGLDPIERGRIAASREHNA